MPFSASGLGKTTLAKIVANELGSAFYQTSGPSIEKPGVWQVFLLASRLVVCYCDEIHRLPITVEEFCIQLWKILSISCGQGPATRTVRMPINPFTSRCNHRVASLSAPLISRFGIQEHLDFLFRECFSRSINEEWGFGVSAREDGRELARL